LSDSCRKKEKEIRIVPKYFTIARRDASAIEFFPKLKLL